MNLATWIWRTFWTHKSERKTQLAEVIDERNSLLLALEDWHCESQGCISPENISGLAQSYREKFHQMKAENAALRQSLESVKAERNRAAMDERNKYLPMLAVANAKLEAIYATEPVAYRVAARNGMDRGLFDTDQTDYMLDGDKQLSLIIQPTREGDNNGNLPDM